MKIALNILIYLSVYTSIFLLLALVSMRPGSLPWWQYFFYINTGLGWVYGTAGLTGVFLIIILLIMVIFSLSVVRKKGFFEVSTSYKLGLHFYHSHYLLGVLLDPQPLHSLVHSVDSPWYTLLEVVHSPCTGLHH